MDTHQRSLNELLRWSVENTQEGDAPSRPIQQLDPSIIDHILGMPDSVRMKEIVKLLTQTAGELNIDDRITLWDELEMLVENLDNANDLKTLKLWDPIIEFISADKYADEDVMHACWVAGTAVQNNIKSQSFFLDLNPLPKLFAVITSSRPAKTRSKALYCLSGTLKQNPAALAIFNQLQDGWSSLSACLEDSDQSIRNKVSFIIYGLIAFSNPPSVSKPEADSKDGENNENGTDRVHPAFDSLSSTKVDTTASLPLLPNLRNARILSKMIDKLSQIPPPSLKDDKNSDEEDDDGVRENYTRSLAALLQHSAPSPPVTSIFNFKADPLTSSEIARMAQALRTERERLACAPNHDGESGPADFSLTQQEWNDVEEIIASLST